MSTKRTRAVYQLKVSLRDIEPPIWRRIHVWEDTKLPQLHRILQLSFNWEDYHLHDFVVWLSASGAFPGWVFPGADRGTPGWRG